MIPVQNLSPQQCIEKAKQFALPFYKSCFPFDDKVTAVAIHCLSHKDTEVSDMPFDTMTCAIPNYTPGFDVELSYKDRKVHVAISKAGDTIYSHEIYHAENENFTDNVRTFILSRMSSVLTAEQKPQLEIAFIRKRQFDMATLKTEIKWRFQPLPKTAFNGWIVNLKSMGYQYKFRIYDNPNELCWKMKEIEPYEVVKKKEAVSWITAQQHEAKLAAARKDLAKVAKVHREEKIIVIPNQVKDQVQKWLAISFPLAIVNMTDISFKKCQWRNDIPYTDFYGSTSWCRDFGSVNGYEFDFSYLNETFKARYSEQGDRVRCAGLENGSKLPRNLVEDLRKETGNASDCRVISYQVQGEDYCLTYQIQGSTSILRGKY